MRRDDPLQKAIKGAIFFGVPNLGMEQSHLMAMVDGQPTETIVADLFVNSEYLRQLDQQFAGIAYLQRVQLYWAYETRKSPTVIKNTHGAWERTGPEEILVTQHSAACGLYEVHSRSDSIFPINENHSNMVKFAENDPDYNIVVNKLVQIVAQMKDVPSHTSELEVSKAQNPTPDPKATAFDVLKSLAAPKRDYRLEQIENKFRNTFDWIYHLQEPGLNQWLQNGAGLFWINGKPGSGKSTLMKFIFRDSRTKELLSDWKTSAVQIHAAFFFHHRELQKDEYDGHLESICKFLSDIGRIPQTAAKRIQVCFSSRPWEIFTGEFGNCPGFSIQDYTKDDIRDFCLGSIENEHLSNTILESLVPYLVERSKGVFLWVKLVVKELAQDFRTNPDRQELEERLRALPTELNEYYAEIIERIPHAHRWMTYAMLEIVVRSSGPPKPRVLVYSLSSAASKSYSECVAKYEALMHQELNTPETEHFAVLARSYSSIYCGGLLEVVMNGYDDKGVEALRIQVFHQTVEDFVISPKFKTLVLGDLAKITIENGNSFLAKFFLWERIHYYEQTFNRSFQERLTEKMAAIVLRRQRKRLSFVDPDTFPRYAKAAEKTTGHSMKSFLGNVPARSFGYFRADTLLGLAFHHDLQLLMSDILVADPEALRKSTEPFITRATRGHRDTFRAASKIRFLLDAGFGIDQDPFAWRSLLTEINEIRMSLTDLELNDFLDGAKIFIEHGQSPDALLSRRNSAYRRNLTWKPLHIARLSLTKLLLEFGANVNGLDSRGQTPLDNRFGRRFNFGEYRLGDTILKRWKKSQWQDDIKKELYQVICLLVSKGGKTRKASARDIRMRLEEFAEYGWETEALYRALLPEHAPSGKSFGSRFAKLLEW
ncbi:hypothetical protein E8E14_007710 [Neopestalotiopsis sp. 37M]|nr:hypothetical protein E8E14_007710 [Neopestalotiopsis sp. 37M]